MTHSAGFVNIIGQPNVGKSTLINAIIGEKLAIATSKVQTTRHRIMGIMNTDDYQIVFSDTPGIIEPSYKMQEGMMQFVRTALSDADIMLLVIDPSKKSSKDESFEKVLSQLKDIDIPLIIAINKLDLVDQTEAVSIADEWKAEFPKAHTLLISALHNFNIPVLLTKIVELLPESPPFYPKDQWTDKSERFFVSETIREKILKHYRQEIPYSVEVVVESFKEEEKITKIRAIINVIRESQKVILVGKAGMGVKRIGTEARKDLEKFLDKKVFLDLQVKVNKDWRDKDSELRKFGYIK